MDTYDTIRSYSGKEYLFNRNRPIRCVSFLHTLSTCSSSDKFFFLKKENNFLLCRLIFLNPVGCSATQHDNQSANCIYLVLDHLSYRTIIQLLYNPHVRSWCLLHFTIWSPCLVFSTIMTAMGSPINIHLIKVMIVKYKCNRITLTIIG